MPERRKEPLELEEGEYIHPFARVTNFDFSDALTRSYIGRDRGHMLSVINLPVKFKNYRGKIYAETDPAERVDQENFEPVTPLGDTHLIIRYRNRVATVLQAPLVFGIKFLVRNMAGFDDLSEYTAEIGFENKPDTYYIPCNGEATFRGRYEDDERRMAEGSFRFGENTYEISDWVFRNKDGSHEEVYFPSDERLTQIKFRIIKQRLPISDNS